MRKQEADIPGWNLASSTLGCLDFNVKRYAIEWGRSHLIQLDYYKLMWLLSSLYTRCAMTTLSSHVPVPRRSHVHYPMWPFLVATREAQHHGTEP